LPAKAIYLTISAILCNIHSKGERLITSALSPRERTLIQELLERGTRILGLRVCYHDHLRTTGLPERWQIHANPACLEVKSTRQGECSQFCGLEMDRLLPSKPDGSVHTCPFGHTDIAVAVMLEGQLAGILSAGVCWTGKGKPVREGMAIPESSAWLDDRRVMLCAIGRQIEHLLSGGGESGDSRKEKIQTFLNANLGESVRLDDLAKEMCLSASRTGHLVKELFGETFPQLLQRIRLAQAARRLGVADTPIGEIALDTGFADQSHFTRAFSKRYRMSPLAYRKSHRQDV
jgi:AraC-like DNA-binding protein